MDFETYLKNKIIEQRNINVLSLKKSVLDYNNGIKNKETRLFSKKLKLFISKNNMTEQYVIENLLSNNLFALLHFTKDPIKQNIVENTMKQFVLDSEIKIKKPKNYESIRFKDGDCHIGFEKKSGYCKSVDFVCGTDYIYCKYINENGGSQDNQYNEVLFCIKEALKYTEKHKIKFYFILEGKFFEKKMKYLTEYINENLIVCSISEFVKLKSNN